MTTTIEWVGLPDVLGCGWCQRSDLSKQQLKQCGGCGAVRYCSKACQRTAWPYHKSTCRSNSSETVTGAEQAGYTAPLSLANAVKLWANTHEDAFSTVVHTIVRSRGGVDWVLSNERCIVFYLRPLAHYADNPATAFEVTSLMLVSRDADLGDEHADEPFRDLWEEPLRASRAQDAAQIVRTDPNPRFAGLLPATFMVADTEVVLHSHYALYRPEDHDDGAPLPERVEAAFYDLQRLCVRAIAVGLVLRNPTDGSFPQVGYMLQERKKWVWKPMKNPLGLMAMTQDADDRPRRSKLSLRELWKLWRQW
ncbi:hypothetical protein GSI_07356 [Ganoderma sinense ZZ0214-1]|uniref:MYND-type domain-containing protein n=1 Tax=Ganoderma sinense ZZ0214-1 TaxID=1077348 RepID=A0A2G8SA79_9APHY|nr:hypothetical protein GSI_07356 [Ganoderma sinense ZZ0214-1]